MAGPHDDSHGRTAAMVPTTVKTLRDRAREAYAAAIEAQGPAYRNTADSIRAGYEGFWVTPAINALEAMIRNGPDEADDETTTEDGP